MAPFSCVFTAAQVRNEDIEGKVYLLENLSAVPEDLDSSEDMARSVLLEEMGERRAWFSPGEPLRSSGSDCS